MKLLSKDQKHPTVSRWYFNKNIITQFMVSRTKERAIN